MRRTPSHPPAQVIHAREVGDLNALKKMQEKAALTRKRHTEENAKAAQILSDNEAAADEFWSERAAEREQARRKSTNEDILPIDPDANDEEGRAA